MIPIAGIPALALLAGCYLGMVLFQFYEHKLEGNFRIRVKRSEIGRSCEAVFTPGAYQSSAGLGDYLLSFRLSEKLAIDISFLISGSLSLFVSLAFASFWIALSFSFPGLLGLVLVSLLLNFIVSLFALPRLASRINYQNRVNRSTIQRLSAGCLALPYTNFIKIKPYLRDLFLNTEVRSLRDDMRGLKFATKLELIYFTINTLVFLMGFWLILSRYSVGEVTAGEAFGAFYVLNFCLNNIRTFADYPLKLVSINQTLKLNNKFFSRLSSEKNNIQRSSSLRTGEFHVRKLECNWGQGRTFKMHDLKLNPGDWLAIRGENGSGKSTLLRAFAGLLPSNYLDWTLNGETQNESAASYVTYVSTHDQLFKGSPEDNVCFFSGSDEDHIKARHLLSVIGFYQSIDQTEGFNFTLGPLGEGLSRGQKQRLMIARALFTKPSILILDEATSGIDGAAENSIFQGLRSDFPELIILYVNHREEATGAGFSVASLEAGELRVH